MINLLCKTFSFIFFSLIISSCSDNTILQPLPMDATVLAFGDSLTYGTGTSRDKAYPTILEQLLQRKVINAGKPGEITRDGLLRLPSLLDRHQPELVILCHGGNDILRKMNRSHTKDNLQKMINLIQQENSQIIIVGVPEFGLFLNAAPIYTELANQNNLTIENDILSDLLGTNSLKSDHIHPNAKGYQQLAESIHTLLKHAGAVN